MSENKRKLIETMKAKMPHLEEHEVNLIIDMGVHASQEALKTWINVLDRLPAHIKNEGTAVGIGILQLQVKDTMETVIQELMKGVISRIIENGPDQ